MNEQQPGTHALFVSTSTTPTRPPPTEVMHDPGYRPVLIEPPPADRLPIVEYGLPATGRRGQ